MEQPRNNKSTAARWDVDKVRCRLEVPPAPQREIRGIGEILDDVVEGLSVPQCENILILRKAWPELVGAPIAMHSEPGFIKDFALHVFVDHPGWMSELERSKRLFLQRLQGSYANLRIRHLRFLLRR
jgi:predicted nucleic acid-binding Zn ribbon protein